MATTIRLKSFCTCNPSCKGNGAQIIKGTVDVWNFLSAEMEHYLVNVLIKQKSNEEKLAALRYKKK